MKKYFLIVLSLILLLFTACTFENDNFVSEPNKAKYRTISPKGAKTLLDNGKEMFLVDVRTEQEYNEKHILGAILIPNEEIGSFRPEKLDDLDATVIIYCRSGNRSKTASEKLISMGYTDVRDLGGINNWPYATVSGSEKGEWKSEETTENTGLLSSFTATDLYGAKTDESALSDYKLTMVNVWA